MINPSRSFRLAQLPWIAAMPLLLLGCGGDGVDRHDLHGNVMYQGTPVAAGAIYFTPDRSKGNSGPGSYAQITDGKYSTAPGQGVVGGAYQLRIVGYDAPPAGEGSDASAGGKPLFPEYEGQFELPAEGGKFDIEVPATP